METSWLYQQREDTRVYMYLLLENHTPQAEPEDLTLFVRGWQGPRYGKVSRRPQKPSHTQTELRHLGGGLLGGVNIYFGAI